MRVHLEQEDTVEKQTYDSLKADQIDINDNAWDLAHKIVRRAYPEEDVKLAHYLQNKYQNVNTIAPDSCFHFHYMGEVEDRDYDNNPIMKEKAIEKHFDFRLNGSIEGESDSNSSDKNYGYALYRDEINAQEGCNADINIEQEGKSSNPHLTKFQDANNQYLKADEDDAGYGKQWNDKYKLDLIGREYCRDRSIACSKDEFMMLESWKAEKGKFVRSHEIWIKSILTQMKEIKIGLKGYKYLDEAIELSNELGLAITDAEIVRTNSTGLTIYNPKNLADRIKGMKNKKEKSRAEKIAERLLYEKQAENSVN
jgi:hypothetical protein